MWNVYQSCGRWTAWTMELMNFHREGVDVSPCCKDGVYIYGYYIYVSCRVYYEDKWQQRALLIRSHSGAITDDIFYYHYYLYLQIIGVWLMLGGIRNCQAIHYIYMQYMQSRLCSHKKRSHNISFMQTCILSFVRTWF